MRSTKAILFSFFMMQGMLSATDFSRFSTMCDTTATQHCPNKPNEVRALQKALNADPSLYLFIKENGKWDLATKEAVMIFQQRYGIKPASGYVGKQTRMFLQKVAGATKALKAKHPTPAKKPAAKPTPVKKKKPTLPKASPTKEFVLYGDMCDNKIAGNHCPNKLIEVSNLQILLNADRNLNIDISPDGKWGRGTQNAIIAFQKRYGITPASGYVGTRTKRMLDRVAGAMVAQASTPVAGQGTKPAKAPKTSHKTKAITSWHDVCEKTATDTCPNRPEDVQALQSFLNKTLKLKLTVDGKWGRGTQKAVILFQKKHHINPASGYVGGQTRKIMQQVARKPHADNRSHKPASRKHPPIRTFADFRKYNDYPRTFKVYKDAKLLARANGRNTTVKIDVSEQRMRLYVHNKVALDSPCTTGSRHKIEPNTHTIRNKSTPKGTFHITEKLANKRSTIFGDIYRNGHRIYHGDRRKYRGSWSHVTFVGHTLRNWMRLTSSGIGLHASRYIKRKPGSNGCVRLPYKVASVVFRKVKPGTQVRIVN